MAKAKKTESKSDAAPPKKPAAPAKKTTKPKTPGAASGGIQIDTGLVAQVAAAAIANKGLMQTQKQEDFSHAKEEKKESEAFKNLKESLAKPGSSTLNQFLQNTTSPAAKKSNLPFGPAGGGGKQVGHNQTFGADVTRSGVPRRTPG